MSEPYIGEIRMVGFNFAPNGWAFCDGALIAIDQNPTLYDLIGTTYGGDGVTTYALPDLRSRRVVHQGSGYVLGQRAGVEAVTLTQSQLPSHSHSAMASSAPGTSTSPQGAVWASGSGSTRPYVPGGGATAMLPGIVSSVGGSQPHDNMPPFLTINFIIALYGIFPSQN